MEGGTDDGGLSRLRSTVSAVSDGEDKRLRPDRSHLGERIRPVGNRPSDEDHRPGVEQTTRNKADDTRVPTRGDRLRSREDRRAILTRLRRGNDRSRGAGDGRRRSARDLGRERRRGRGKTLRRITGCDQASKQPLDRHFQAALSEVARVSRASELQKQRAETRNTVEQRQRQRLYTTAGPRMEGRRCDGKQRREGLGYSNRHAKGAERRTGFDG